MTTWERPEGASEPAAETPPPSPAAGENESAIRRLDGAQRDALAATTLKFDALRDQVGGVIVGQDALITRLLISLLCDGHCLIEGVPGLAKSLTVSTLSRAIDAEFVRLQFTPDLLPADLTGTEIYNAGLGEFEVRRGPIFANVILADEVNRAPAKVQSALLEAMEERQVSIGGESFPLPEPFMVLATQNPIEQEGTYPLPEAQLDRFMLKVLVDYPEEQAERVVLDQHLGAEPAAVRTVINREELLVARESVRAVRLEPAVREYVVRLIRATRAPERMDAELGQYVSFGASPRASIYLAQAARAHAFLRGRDHTTPDDVKALAQDVLRHRIVVTYEAEADGVSADHLIAHLLDGVAVL